MSRHRLRRALRFVGGFVFTALVLFVAGAAHADPLDNLASRLARGTTKLSNRKIAVLLFTYPDGEVSSGSTLVAEGLTTRLVGRKGISIIERSQLAKLTAEYKLELSGVTQSSTTQKLGRVLGVDGIITGTLIDQNDGKTMVNARLIDTANGEVLAAAATTIHRSWYDQPHALSEPTR